MVLSNAIGADNRRLDKNNKSSVLCVSPSCKTVLDYRPVSLNIYTDQYQHVTYRN